VKFRIINKNSFDKYFSIAEKIYSSNFIVICLLLFIKVILQITILNSGFKWLSADDFCRTVKSFEWMKHPQVYSGVWLAGHFWLNGIVMYVIKDLYTSAVLVNVVFSTATLVYFYKIVVVCFDKKIAILSSLILCIFPFQVWLSISGLPESIFFFFIIAGIYYFIKWKISGNNKIYLILCAVSFAFSNLFRYEGWLFSLTFVLLIVCDMLRTKKISKEYVIFFAISLISFSTVIFWLVLNYIDYKDIFYFAKETTKIYEEFSTARMLQRVVQYPTFIFYIAPITTIFSLKIIYIKLRRFKDEKSEQGKMLIYFLSFNLIELLLLMLQGMMGTGGTNMISRYIVINALLFLPFAIWQVLQFRKSLSVLFLSVIIIVNIIWCFYYPHPFRDDTYETGKLINNRIERKYIKGEDKIYFEEVEGYYDVFAVQTLSNNPSKFILGEFPLVTRSDKITKKKKSGLSDEELNILDIKSFFEKNKISLAVVKSDGYADKLRKMNLKNEDIGDYKIFYLKDFESNINDSTISILAQNVESPGKNPEMINFNKTIAVKDYSIDNSNFGFNPQTITIDWCAVNKYIIDSLDYDKYEFDRYQSVIEIATPENDSVVYSESRRIFGDRNIEELVERNEVRTIIVLKPFAMIFYSRKFNSSPFESGVYKLILKVFDSKTNKNMQLFKGDSLYTLSEFNLSDSIKTKSVDSLKTKSRITNIKKDARVFSYNLGNIIAMFPNTNIDRLVKRSNSDFYRIITQNGLRIFFSQRYQGDNFLNFVFNYF
jgi:hypothetical protein